MSGVFGIVYSLTRQKAIKPILNKMGNAMSHRPWYRVECVCDEQAALGFGRIGIGIANAEEQPVSNTGASVDLFMAGEFYYRDNLMRALEDKGRTYLNASDAELALQLYLRQGPGFARTVEGIFCIAIWDHPANQLIIINDRFGLLPLYYAHNDERFIFAPELKAILCAPGFDRRLDETALVEYVRFQQLLGAKTFFEDILLMPPATILQIDTREWQLAHHTYWDASGLSLNEAHIDRREIAEETYRLMRRAVQARLERAQRPGIFLSGGLDSRIILSIARQHAGRINTFTYGHPECRDVHVARQLARAAGTDHHFYPLHDGNWVKEIADFHMELVEGAHSWMHAHGLSILPEARKLIDVNLSGVAGAFGGLFYKPGLVYAPDTEALLHNLYLFYTQQHSWPGLTDNEERTLFTESYRQRLNGRAFESLRAELKHLQHLDPRLQSTVFNLENHSRRMNHNLIIFNNSHFENRCPLFDYELTDWALQLPPELKIHKQMHIAVLHRTAPQFTRIPYDKDYRLPTHNRLLRQMHAAFDRSIGRLAQKMGYGYARYTVYADYEEYLRGELRSWAEDILFDERTLTRGIFRREALRSLMDRHLIGREPWVIGKFNVIISLEMVLRRFFDT